MNIKSVFSSVLLMSAVLIPVSVVLAQDAAVVPTVTSEIVPVRAQVREGMQERREEVKDLREEQKASLTAVREQRKVEREERRSENFQKRVASSSEVIARLSDKLGQLGTEIKAIVNDQASTSEAIRAAIAKDESRGGIKRFFLGSDYKNLGQVVSEVAKTQARINQLEGQVSRMSSTTDKNTLIENIQTLKNEVSSVETYVKDNINKFSLFGWFTKRFNK